MFAWLDGPGSVFRNPLPNSSNYLSAYDKQGNLTRARQYETEQLKRSYADLDEPEEFIVEREREDELSQEEMTKRADQRARRRVERRELEARDWLPKEQARDLRPYPLNRQFRSQAVLSEELRQKIHELVAERGIDIKAVSASFGVDIRRVAAVVRLVAVEKKWVEEVSSRSLRPRAFHPMMIPIQNSISLEDYNYMVTKR